jgi:predicted restriction endonuclease
MPEIEAFADIDPDEFFSACSRREQKDLIDIVVEESTENTDLQDQLFQSLAEHYPEKRDEIHESLRETYSSIMRDEFITSLVKLGEAYYQLSNEDIEKINELAKRF